jgi:hypothetical protein
VDCKRTKLLPLLDNPAQDLLPDNSYLQPLLQRQAVTFDEQIGPVRAQDVCVFSGMARFMSVD